MVLVPLAAEGVVVVAEVEAPVVAEDEAVGVVAWAFFARVC